jgi:hypothetical protein
MRRRKERADPVEPIDQKKNEMRIADADPSLNAPVAETAARRKRLPQYEAL